MKGVVSRLLVFGLLGPTLGFLMIVAVIIGFGMGLSDKTVLFVIFSYAFVAGILPAVLTGLADWHLATRMNFSRRILATATVGFLLCALVGLTLLNRRLSIGAVLIFALFGMIAATVCSWLSGKQTGASH